MVALVAVLIGATAVPTVAQTSPSVTRLSGDTRIETAIAISTDSFEAGAAATVVLARSDAFPDALAGGPLAAVKRGPLLLTVRSELTPLVREEIERVLAPGGTVFLLGGTAALSDAVAEGVRDAGFTPVRLSGPTRYETALAIAEEAAPDPGFIVIATGNDFPDALIGGSLASAFRAGVLVLTDGENVPGPLATYLDDNADVDKTTIGPAAGAAVDNVFNVSGDTPAQRSISAAQTFYTNLAPGGVALASVERFPDGLSGAAHAFRSGPLPLLLTPGEELPAVHVDYIESLTAEGPSFVYGGTAAISDDVAAQLQSALEG